VKRQNVTGKRSGFITFAATMDFKQLPGKCETVPPRRD